MADGQLRTVIGQLRRLIGGQGGSTLSDAQLLDAFVARRDEAAFEVLVWRHGTMVFNLCQRVLRDSHQAEDAFQATFLVFVRKASSIGKRESLGSWLYKVAFRIACRAQAKAAKNAPAATDLAALSSADCDVADDVVWRDLRPVLDEEINRLPEKFRTPLVLCHLQGHTNEEAAQMLGCPKGTILSRLARGREKLRSRLVRRGVVLSVGWLAAHLSSSAASAAVPAGLVGATIKVSLPFAAGAAAAGLVSTSIASLTNATLHAFFLTKVKLAACAVLMLAVLGASGGTLMHWALTSSDASPSGNPTALAPNVRTDVEPNQVAPMVERPQDQVKPDEPRLPEDDPGQTHVGRVAGVAADGSGIVLEASPRGRDAEPQQLAVSLGPKTTITYNGVGPGGARLTAGYGATVRIEKNETLSVVFHGDESARNGPELTGKVVDFAADGKSFTLEEGTTGRERNEVAKRTLLRCNDRTQMIFSGVAVGGAKLANGQRAQIWLADDPAGNVVARAHCIGSEVLQSNRNESGPDLTGRIVSVSPDGKFLSIAQQVREDGGEPNPARGRSKDAAPADGGRRLPETVDVRLNGNTTVVFQNVLAGSAKMVLGQQAAVWLAPDSKDQARMVGVTGGPLPERWETITGNVVAVLPENRITLEVRVAQSRDGARGDVRPEPVKKIEILLTPKTRMTFQGVGPDEASVKIGYAVTVRLADGLQGVAAQVVFSKPGGNRAR